MVLARVMQVRIKLFHKGLLLVGILLGCEFIFVGAMAHLLAQADAEAAQLAHSKEIIDETNYLLQKLNDMSQSFSLRGFNSETFQDERFLVAQKAIPAQFEKIRKLLKDSPKQRAQLDDAERLVLDSNAVLLQVRDAMQGGYSPFDLIGMGGRARNVLKNLRDEAYHDLFNVVEHERQIESRSPAAQEAVRKQQRTLLILGLVLNIGVAIAMTLWFSRGITGRLQVILQNTLRLAQRQTLRPRLSGTDEIAQLDHVFHDVAEALVEADRKEAELARLKREFVAMASHELRTPLTSVHGTLTLAKEGVFGDTTGELQQRLSESVSNVDRLITLINDVLDMEKIQSGTIAFAPAPTAVQKIIDGALMATRSFADAHKVAIEADSCDLSLKVDQDRMIQVFVNLLSNAIKYSPEHGTVRLEVEAGATELEVRFKDQGPGIPESYREIIFERFQQVDDNTAERKPGTGLGLAIAKTIVEQHGGTIGVDSELGAGSSFWIRLPIS